MPTQIFEAPLGVRSEDDAHLYREETSNPLIEPDRVSPGVESYFRIPAIWVGDAPSKDTVMALNPSVHHQIAYSKELKCGIKVLAQRDGLFSFDFSNWAPAPLVIIPGFTKPNATGPYRPPIEHRRIAEKAEQYAVTRAKVMNVHQACLVTAERLVKSRSADMGVPVTYNNTFKSIYSNNTPAYQNDTSNTHAIVRNSYNNKDAVTGGHPFNRRVLEIEVIAESFKILDSILVDDKGQLIDLVEAAYIAACRNKEKRHGEALTIAWGACEQILTSEWQRMIDNVAASSGRMSRDRKKKLVSHAYTASVMSDVLELLEIITHDQYRQLEIARKARNKWMHELKPPKESEVLVCLSALQSLLSTKRATPLRLQPGSGGGVPMWNYWIWAASRTSEA